MTIEFIFALVTAVITAIFGTFFKDSVVPAKLIPLQNLVIGVIAAFVAVYFGIFDNIPTAILVSLGMSMGVGGAYDLTKTKLKVEE